jgi:hypothetical protein
MNTVILQSHIDLVKTLGSTSYTGLSMKGIAPLSDINALKDLQKRLKEIADFFKARYDKDYGVFEAERTTGNPVGRTGKLRRVWSGVYKGTYNKQYSAQISFVINTPENCLDVGFYFGRASAQDMKKEERLKLESHLKELGLLLFKGITADPVLRQHYNYSAVRHVPEGMSNSR